MATATKLIFSNTHRYLSLSPHFNSYQIQRTLCSSRNYNTTITNNNINRATTKKNQEKKKKSLPITTSVDSQAFLKRRTRSEREFDPDHILRFFNNGNNTHLPVMLGEVLEVFACPLRPLNSFVDCTLGAAGHSSAIIQAHPELQIYVGMDVDPVAHDKAQAQISSVLNEDPGGAVSGLKVHTALKNFKDVKFVLRDVDEELLDNGVDGILMDLGMSSMQVNNFERGFSVLNDGPLDMRMDPRASLRAEDVLNSWPEDEVGRILREYGEESNWRALQNKIVKARLRGGLHSTSELANLVQSMSPKFGGRQGWIKTATRVFQALRIAVNDELKTLEDALYDCFDCLSDGGRLAVISFHSLEDRIVKKTFLDIISTETGDGDNYEDQSTLLRQDHNEKVEEGWVKQRIDGKNGTILTKRPITPSEEEESLNRRSRSAKLRVLQKVI